jgi:hypothetical protein
MKPAPDPSRRAPRRASAALGCVLALIATAASGSSARASSPPPAGGARAHVPAIAPSLASKLDPRLLAAALEAGGDPIPVWIVFADKGEQSPADLAARLAAAERDLSPRTRARRLRAGVKPLCDYLDLPLHAGYLDALRAAGLEPYGQSRWFNRVAIRVPGERLGELASLSFVRLLAPVERARVSADPAPSSIVEARSAPEPGFGIHSVSYGQTAAMLAQIQVPAMHDSGYIGSGVLVCVLDEGFNFHHKHEALRNQPIPPERQRDFVRGLPTAQDTTDTFSFHHGTWVLGCIAGNLPGTYVGAAFGAEFALARTEVHITETPQEMVYWGMGAEWADSLGADIISSSLGYYTFDDSEDDYAYQDMDGHTTIVTRAAEIAASKGILVVTAVGNEGNSPWHYLIAPSDANGDSVLAVGAVDASGTVASFSSWGPSADGRTKPDIAARGVAVPVPSAAGNPNLYLSSVSGTSFSTPQIAGLAACLMQARPTWSARTIAVALRATASRASNPDDRVGYGIANGAAALQWAPSTGVPGSSPNRLRLAGANPARLDQAPIRVRFGDLDAGGSIAEPGNVTVFDAAGREVRRLWSGMVPSGSPVVVSWDGRDQDGRPAGSGLYFITLTAGEQHSTVRVVALR